MNALKCTQTVLKSNSSNKDALFASLFDTLVELLGEGVENDEMVKRTLIDKFSFSTAAADEYVQYLKETYGA